MLLRGSLPNNCPTSRRLCTNNLAFCITLIVDYRSYLPTTDIVPLSFRIQTLGITALWFAHGALLISPGIRSLLSRGKRFTGLSSFAGLSWLLSPPFSME